MSKTIYQKIWDREIPSYELYRYASGDGEGLTAFLDIHPATPGHTLIVSEQPYEQWTDVPPATIERAALLGHILGRHLKTVLAANRIVRLTFGDAVPHFHDHLVPSYERGDVVGRMQPSSGRMQETVDHNGLSVMQAELALPEDLADLATESLDRNARLSEIVPHLEALFANRSTADSLAQ